MVEIRLLGPIRVLGDDGADVAVSGRREKAILAALAVDPGRLVTADALLEMVWGEDLPADPRHALQSAMSRLRRALANAFSDEIIATDGPGYRLTAAVSTDLARFRELVGRAGAPGDDLWTTRARLSEALEMAKGDLLVDFAYADWALPHIESFEERRISAVGDRVEVELRLGRHRDVVPRLQELTSSYPLRERFHGQLMLALYRSGRPEAALGAFAEARRALGEQLGVEPSAELRRLEQSILDQDPALDAPAEHSPGRPAAPPGGALRSDLPVQLTSFVGREPDLEVLLDIAGEHRFITLTGPGGTGKTRLAIELATRLTTDAGPTAFVDLTAALAADQVWHVIAGALGVQEQATIALASLTARHIGTTPLLVVMDNCEHVVAEIATAISELLSHCPSLSIIATSREPLKAAGEVVWPVAPLRPPPGPDAANDEDLESYDSVRLFLDRLDSLAPRTELDENQNRDVATICVAVEGIPLAVELAAARAAAIGVTDVANLMSHGLGILRGGLRTAPPRQQTFDAAIRWSYDLQSLDEQAFFRCLGVFRGGFDLESAARVSGLDVAGVVDPITRLVESSLITRMPSSVPAGRYRLLEPIRQFAMGELDATGEADSARRAHCAHFARLAVRVSQGLRSHEQAKWLDVVEVERVDLLAALDHALATRQTDRAFELASGLGPYFQVRGRLTEGRSLMSRVLEVDTRLAGLRATVLTDLAHLSFFQCDYGEMNRYAAAAAAAVDAAALPRIAAAANAAGALAALKAQDHATARDLLDEAARLYTAAGDSWGAGSAFGYLGFVALDEGDVDEAWARYTRSLELLRGHGESWIAAFSLCALGELARVSGDIQTAEELLAEGLAVSQRIEDSWGAARARLFGARVQLDRGDVETARALLAEALDDFVRMGDREDTALCLGAFADIAHRGGDLERAAALVGAAESLRGAVVPAFSSHNIEYGALTDTVAEIRDTMGEQRFESAIAAGRSLDRGAAVAMARELAGTAAETS